MLQKSLTNLDSKGAVTGFYNLNSENRGIAGLFVQGYYFVISVGAIPFRLVNYKNMGERSFGIIAFFMSFFAYFILTVGLTVIVSMITFENFFSDVYASNRLILCLTLFAFLNFSTVYISAIFIYGIKFLKEKFRNHNSPYLRHSYYRGDLKRGSFTNYEKRKFLGFTGENIDYVRMIFVPRDDALASFFALLGVIVFAIIANSYFSQFVNLILFLPVLSLFFTAMAILISSGFAALEEYEIYKKIRDSVLDTLDAEKDLEILMTKKMELLNGKEAKKQFSPKKESYPTVRIY